MKTGVFIYAGFLGVPVFVLLVLGGSIDNLFGLARTHDFVATAADEVVIVARSLVVAAVVPMLLLCMRLYDCARHLLKSPADLTYSDGFLETALADQAHAFEMSHVAAMRLACDAALLAPEDFLTDVYYRVVKLRVSGQELRARELASLCFSSGQVEHIFARSGTFSSGPVPAHDEALKAVLSVERLNWEKSHGSPEANSNGEDKAAGAPVRFYPCSKAVPAKVWEEAAHKKAAMADKLQSFARNCQPAEKILLLTQAATDYASIDLGPPWCRRSGNCSEKQWHDQTRPIAEEILQELETGNTAIEVEIFILHRLAAISMQCGHYELAARSFGRLVPLVETIIDADNACLAPLLSNQAAALQRSGKFSQSLKVRKKALQIWKRAGTNCQYLDLMQT